MNKLSTKYLGLDLKSPVIAGSSGLTSSVGKIKRMEEAGAGAIVLKSLFEEQINNFASQIESQSHTDYPEALDYIRAYNKSNALELYLDLIVASKKTCTIPIIASVSCVSTKDWVDFSKQIEQAGADALELNLFYLPTDKQRTANSYEQVYLDMLDEVKRTVSIPVAVKIGSNFTNLINMVQQLLIHKANGVVLFNRFYEPDIDIDKMALVSGNVFSNPSDLRLVLRWLALLSAKVPSLQYSASTGIHDGKAAVKQILAGATTVQLASTLYQNGVGQITKINDFIVSWMQQHGFKTIQEFQAKLNYTNIPDPEMYERAQFMKHFSSKSDE